MPFSRLGYMRSINLIPFKASLIIIGLLIYKVIEKILKDSNKAQKLINVIATLGTISMVLLLALLVIYNL